jgi:PKD repeat protein
LDGSGGLVTAVPIPASTVFNGFQFDVQSVDLDLFTLALRWAENDVEATTTAVTAPVASFTATPTSGNAPLTVQFTDTSTQNPTAWQWDFDNDGVVDSTQQNPSWTYTSNGVYSVRLVATNFAGNGVLASSNLVIVGPINPLLNMVAIPPGIFQMGQIGLAEAVHQVTISSQFWMGKYEVTQSQFQAVMGTNPSIFSLAANAAQRPVENVTWYQAVAYCQSLTAAEQAAGRVPLGYQYRLPTEAEWEYCCRAGTITEWNTGNVISISQANFGGSVGQTTVVGSYLPNAFGLYDMHGNVWEWVVDSTFPYAAVPVVDPVITGGPDRGLRGAGWAYAAPECRSAKRGGVHPSYTTGGYGFRVVLAPVIGQ